MQCRRGLRHGMLVRHPRLQQSANLLRALPLVQMADATPNQDRFDFEPWLSRIERFPSRQLQGIADEIPCEWYGERSDLQRLMDCLLERRSIVRQLIEGFRTSSRNPFPNWTMTTSPPATQSLISATC